MGIEASKEGEIQMSSIGLNRRINKFIDGKHREMPELRDKDVDQLLQEFAREGRSTSIF
jgi:hypothetical protein